MATEITVDREIRVKMADFSRCTVLTESGESIEVRTFWEKAPAIFIFLRHFACEACRRHAVEVWENRKLYEEKGAIIRFIGNGDARFLADFKKLHRMQESNFYTDPSLKTFLAAGFKKGFWIDPGAMHTRSEFLYKALKFSANKENTGSGNVWQLGGVLVVRPGGVPVYQFTSLTMDHLPPRSDIPSMNGRS